MKNTAIAVLGLPILFSNTAFAVHSASCDVEIPSSQHLVDGSVMNIQPGDTVCLAEGERGPLRVKNILGTESQPIIIRNSGITNDTNNTHIAWITMTSIVIITIRCRLGSSARSATSHSGKQVFVSSVDKGRAHF